MRFSIVLTNQKTGAEVILRGEFDPEEWEVLSDFRRYSAEIPTTAMLRDGWRSSPMGYSQGEGSTQRIKNPNLT